MKILSKLQSLKFGDVIRPILFELPCKINVLSVCLLDNPLPHNNIIVLSLFVGYRLILCGRFTDCKCMSVSSINEICSGVNSQRLHADTFPWHRSSTFCGHNSTAPSSGKHKLSSTGLSPANSK